MFSKIEFIWYTTVSVLVSIFYGSLQVFSRKRKALGDAFLETTSNLTDHIIIVTGSNTGIGKSTALQLARMGGTVILACRDKNRGTDAANDINQQLQNAPKDVFPYASTGSAQYIRLDLGHLPSVVEFVETIKRRFPRVDILVNNAGLNTGLLLPTGLQQLFQVNYLGHYLLVRGLEDHLHQSSGVDPNIPRVGKIINLSSVMHHSAQANFLRSALNQFSFLEDALYYSYYSDSKLYMNLLTLSINQREEARLEEESLSSARQRSSSSPNVHELPRRIIAISVNPGAVNSDIWRTVPFQALFKAVVRWIFLSTDEGAATSVAAATMTEACFDAYQRRTANIDGGRMKSHHYIPYLIPYEMKNPRNVLYETTGAFAGAQFAGVTLPIDSNSTSFAKTVAKNTKEESTIIRYKSPQDLATQLWQFSAMTCKNLLSEKVSQSVSSYLDN